MATTIADQYYAKALDHYPFELESAMENVNYSLSYNSEHAGAHCLMGKICAFMLRDTKRAEYHFEQAIAADYELPIIYENYSWMLIDIGALRKAEKLLSFAIKVQGIDKAMVYHRMAIIMERRKNYTLSVSFLQSAMMESIYEKESNFLEEELSRVKKKLKVDRKCKVKNM